MSKKLSVLIAGVVVSLAFAVGTMQGCGSSSSSGNTALCMQACDKILSCTPDAGSVEMMAATMCKANCSSTVSNTHCSNEAAIASAVQACLNMPCDQLATCEAGIPACGRLDGRGRNDGRRLDLRGPTRPGNHPGRLRLPADDRRHPFSVPEHVRLLLHVRHAGHNVLQLHDDRGDGRHLRAARLGPDGHGQGQLPVVAGR